MPRSCKPARVVPPSALPRATCCPSMREARESVEPSGCARAGWTGLSTRPRMGDWAGERGGWMSLGGLIHGVRSGWGGCASLFDCLEGACEAQRRGERELLSETQRGPARATWDDSHDTATRSNGLAGHAAGYDRSTVDCWAAQSGRLLALTWSRSPHQSTTPRRARRCCPDGMGIRSGLEGCYKSTAGLAMVLLLASLFSPSPAPPRPGHVRQQLVSHLALLPARDSHSADQSALLKRRTTPVGPVPRLSRCSRLDCDPLAFLHPAASTVPQTGLG